MDIASLLGVVLGLAGIFLGMTLEGGSLRQMVQPTAALIVVGGTMGAVMLQFPLRVMLAAAMQGTRVFFARDLKAEGTLDQIVGFAYIARRDGILALDGELDTVKDAFLKRALMLAVDGTEPDAVRTIMRLELENRGEMDENIPAVFEAAGGYAPTVGIIGAVLGLIQVMQHLDHIDEVGRGIATAFVATIYGVGLANLVFLPAAGKLKIRQRDEQRNKEMMLDGVISILEGMTPRMIETKLRTYLVSPRAKAGGRRAWPRENAAEAAGDEVAA
jgi:chemotaxis protein MotA